MRAAWCVIVLSGLLVWGEGELQSQELFPSEVALSDLDGSNGFVLSGASRGGNESAVSGAGDVNGDGIADFLLGLPEASGGKGTTYIVFGSSTGFPASIDLTTLDGTNGFVVNGIGSGGLFGWSVSGAGDVNADGIDDIVIGAWQLGDAYVLFGSDAGFPASFELSSLDGTNGFVFHGNQRSDRAGSSVFGAGDVNGDGIDDVVIGADGVGDPSHGAAYVLFGTTEGFPASFEASSLDGTNGFAFVGENYERIGWTASAAGDVNGDGLADMLIGSYSHISKYVLFGSEEGFDAFLTPTDLDGTNGFQIANSNPDDGDNYWVAGAGDVNGDGFSDVLVSASATDDGGATHVVFGSDAGFPTVFDVADVDGTNGFRLSPGVDSERSGMSISGGGDVNGDGLSDIIIGSNAGKSYVVYGSAFGFSAAFDLSSLDGTNGFVLNGAGASVAVAADVNGDGVCDILIDGPGSGNTYVYLGFGCMAGTVNRAAGVRYDVLYVNGSFGGADRTVDTLGDLLQVTLLKPLIGGNGKFVLHGTVGAASTATQTLLPFDVGTTCFPMLASQGASPSLVANNIGKAEILGESRFFDVPMEDPDRATTDILFPGLPIGMTITLQGVIVDPGAVSSRGVSTTNAVIVTAW